MLTQPWQSGRTYPNPTFTCSKPSRFPPLGRAQPNAPRLSTRDARRHPEESRLPSSRTGRPTAHRHGTIPEADLVGAGPTIRFSSAVLLEGWGLARLPGATCWGSGLRGPSPDLPSHKLRDRSGNLRFNEPPGGCSRLRTPALHSSPQKRGRLSHASRTKASDTEGREPHDPVPAKPRRRQRSSAPSEVTVRIKVGTAGRNVSGPAANVRRGGPGPEFRPAGAARASLAVAGQQRPAANALSGCHAGCWPGWGVRFLKTHQFVLA